MELRTQRSRPSLRTQLKIQGLGLFEDNRFRGQQKSFFKLSLVHFQSIERESATGYCIFVNGE